MNQIDIDILCTLLKSFEMDLLKKKTCISNQNQNKLLNKYMTIKYLQQNSNNL